MRLAGLHRQPRAERDERDAQARGRARSRAHLVLVAATPSRRSREARARHAAVTSASAAHRSDPEIRRAREAGGPVDCASYGCECGYQFTAPVSTTVNCPHCGCTQAW